MAGVRDLARAPGLTPVATAGLGWATDLLNGAYYARHPDERDVADLRLAFGLLTTRWARGGRRLDARDGAAFVAALTSGRLRRASGIGRLDRDDLLAGSRRLIGGWFPEAWDDPERRAHGIAFPTAAERAAHDPTERMRVAAPGPITPPQRPDAERVVGTYAPVVLPHPGAALALLAEPARWPDIGCAGGRFTALRRGGLDRQLFEIDLCLEAVPRVPVFTRGYVTCLEHELAEGPACDASVAALEARLGVEVVPPGGRALAHVALTTHAGHPLGPAVSHLVVARDPGGVATIRDVGEWDPLSRPLALAHAAGGGAAQHLFWGPDGGDASMLAQLALVA